jgi:hypothetical protein
VVTVLRWLPVGCLRRITPVFNARTTNGNVVRSWGVADHPGGVAAGSAALTHAGG